MINIREVLHQWVFDKKSALLTDKSAVKSKIMLNQELVEELHKLIISKF